MKKEIYEQLEFLSDNSNYNRIDEDALFKQIDELENQGYITEASFLAITYINFTMNSFHQIRTNKDRPIFNLIKTRVDWWDCDKYDNCVVLSKKVKMGVQTWQNYCYA